MDFSVDLLHLMENEMNTEIQKLLKVVNISSTAEIDETVLMKLNKKPLSNFVTSLVLLVEKNIKLCKSAAGKMDKLKSEQIESQKQLLKFQQGQLDSVQTTVKTEIKSWADVVKKNNNQRKQLTENSVKQAVRAVNEEEKRSKNLMIYGCAEEEGDGDNVVEIVRNVYGSMGDHSMPDYVDIYRMGKISEMFDNPRPIKVELTSASEVEFALTQARKLRTSMSHNAVYLGPDRTKEERVVHNKLVEEMKLLIVKDPNKHYFIRNNKISSVDKS